MKDLEKKITSTEFRMLIKEALMQGVWTDWVYDGIDEYPSDEFDEELATDCVIKTLKEQLT